MPLSDVVAAVLDGLAVDEIDGAGEQSFQRLLEIEKLPEIVLSRCELDQEIDIAACRVEITPRRRAEHVEPPHLETPAQRVDLGPAFRDQGQHGGLRLDMGEIMRAPQFSTYIIAAVHTNTIEGF